MTVPQITVQPEMGSPTERLQSLEKTIESNLTAFFSVGLALTEIRDTNLYKLQGYQSFNKYCQERWDFRSRYAYWQIEASVIMQNLQTNGLAFLPTCERHVRPLAKLSPEQQCQVWKQIIESTPSKIGTGEPKVTTKRVETAVAAITGQKTTPKQPVYKISADADAESLLNGSLDLIRQKLNPPPKKGASKKALIEAFLLQSALQALSN